MARLNTTEITCDTCGWAEHYPYPMTNQRLIDIEGYYVIGNKHYCDEECRRNAYTPDTIAYTP